MSFTSPIFVFYFLPGLLLLYTFLPRRSNLPRNLLLLVASGVFYAWLSAWYVALLWGMIVFHHVASRLIAACGTRRGKRVWMGVCIAGDVGILGFFKYAAFLQTNLSTCLEALGLGTLPLLHVVLPMGVSFTTFKALSYVVDVYRGESPPAKSILDFALYLSFFPQLLSGPIQRYGTLDARSEPVPPFADQIQVRRGSLERFSQGVALFVIGFSKKILLADAVTKVADAVFAAEAPGTLDVWYGAVAYAFGLYLDFSAYSEMAIGVGLMLGFECPRNFNAPYLADSITDFWRRWHISLSSWFRDYLYIPLGGNRKGPVRTYVHLVVVFLLCGLWHGANWTFVLWGSYHGVLLVLERLLGRKTLYEALPRAGRVAGTFTLLVLGWVVFRADSLADAVRWLGLMFSGVCAQGGSVLLGAEIYGRGPLILMGVSALLVFQGKQGFDWIRTLCACQAAIGLPRSGHTRSEGSLKRWHAGQGGQGGQGANARNRVCSVESSEPTICI
jgi:alginate O-acetyltransferase complex protein AlgI